MLAAFGRAFGALAARTDGLTKDQDAFLELAADGPVVVTLNGNAVFQRKSVSKTGNPELRSLSAILKATGLRISVKPIGKQAT